MKGDRPVFVIFIAAALAGCVDATTPRWDLDRDRVVAARFDPPHIAPGEVARITGLVAGEGKGASEVDAFQASAPFAPGGLFTAVHFETDHWQIEAPPDDELAAARAELGLDAAAPVPMQVTIQFPGALYAYKTVYLGDSRANPELPEADAAGEPIDAQLVVARGATTTLQLAADGTERVRWLSTCGTLSSDEESTATLDSADCDTGELAVVMQDDAGGVAWHVWPLQTR